MVGYVEDQLAESIRTPTTVLHCPIQMNFNASSWESILHVHYELHGTGIRLSASSVNQVTSRSLTLPLVILASSLATFLVPTQRSHTNSNTKGEHHYGTGTLISYHAMCRKSWGALVLASHNAQQQAACHVQPQRPSNLSNDEYYTWSYITCMCIIPLYIVTHLEQ